jgi:amino acid transporter
MGRQAQDIQRKHGAGALFSIWISLLLMICLIVLILMLFAYIVDASLLDFIENTLPTVLLVITPLLLLLFLMIWGISRSNALRRDGMTSAQYRSALKDVRLLPKTFFDRAQTLYAPGGTRGKKTMSQGGVIVLLSLVLTVVMGITVWVGVSGNDWSNTAFTSNNSSSSSGGRLSGRWEGQVIGYTTDSHGLTLQQIDAPAIVFRGDKAYWGTSGVDDDAIIGECEGWGVGITTYKIGSGRITFTDASSGESYSFKFDGTTIYYGEYEIQRVD